MTKEFKTYGKPPQNISNSEQTPSSYVPQYKAMGIEPLKVPVMKVPHGTKIVPREPLPLDNPRGRRAPFPVPQPVIQPARQVLNVGNNMDHSWSSVDGQPIVDDLTGDAIDSNQPMINNNDQVSETAFGFQSGFDASDLPNHLPMNGKVTIDQTIKPTVVQNQNSDHHDLLPIISELEDESYLLIVSGVPLCSGSKEEIEDQAKALVFGEHEMCGGEPIPIEDVIVVKKVKIKVGLFLER